MYRKMRARRRAAFLRALEATGNQTLAAERSGMSRSWVCKARQADAGFESACVAAIGAAEACLAAGRSSRAPSGWGFLDGVELVVRRSNRRRLQVARARTGQWTARTEDRFLAVLSATCNVEASAVAAGISEGSAYAHRRRWPAFARRWDEALDCGRLRLEFALARYACNPASSTGPAEPAAVTIVLTPDQALHSLHMHKNRLIGLGKLPGRRGVQPTIEAVTAKIERLREAMRRASPLDPAMREADEREWARRRRSSG